MQRLSDRFLQLAAVSIVIGAGMGLYMGATHDFVLAPAHAHLNLLGWVSMFLFGLFYRTFPQAAASRLATAHFFLNVVGVVVMVPALALQLTGDARAVPVVSISSTVVFLSMALFAVIAFRATGKSAAAAE